MIYLLSAVLVFGCLFLYRSEIAPILKRDRSKSLGNYFTEQRPQARARNESLTEAAAARNKRKQHRANQTRGDYRRFASDYPAPSAGSIRTEAEVRDAYEKHRRSQRVEATPLNATATELHSTLRAWRREKARAIDSPAHFIFDDRTLRAIASRQPKTRSDLLQIAGMGPAKAARFGDEVLALVAEVDGPNF